ncbi:hypothetical protein WR164_14970 [Philodulcilactobacillus myokoensis]|uniref:Uncharacterized protein n=1 Tax=Philodulcilactobacillus myokoensis TaxID=2929573 RepID=A0A9W6B3N1_9LACO|nr:hypothetical protein [Philodulcilactobacillus myokoensis]GLB47518.1 hypothetical protein WR164_14970 [Philodulcilactobacillus myokoensis]
MGKNKDKMLETIIATVAFLTAWIMISLIQFHSLFSTNLFGGYLLALLFSIIYIWFRQNVKIRNILMTITLIISLTVTAIIKHTSFIYAALIIIAAVIVMIILFMAERWINKLKIKRSR